MTIIIGPTRSIDEAKEIGSSIKEDLLDILSFTLGSKVSEVAIVGLNVSPRPGEGGVLNLVMPPPQISGQGYVGAKPLQDDEIG